MKNKGIWVAVLALVILTGIGALNGGCNSTASTSSRTPAAFSVTNLSIQPSEINAGEKVIASAEVKNTGGSEGSYTAELKVNGVTEDSQNLTIPASSSVNISFTVAKDVPGVYQVALDNATGQFVVEAVPVALRTVIWSDEMVTQLLLKEMPGYTVHILSNNKGVVDGGPIPVQVTVGVSEGKIFFGVPFWAYGEIAGEHSTLKTYTEYDGNKLWLTSLPPWVDPTKEIAPDVDKLPFVESVTTKGGEATLTYRWP